MTAVQHVTLRAAAKFAATCCSLSKISRHGWPVSSAYRCAQSRSTSIRTDTSGGARLRSILATRFVVRRRVIGDIGHPDRHEPGHLGADRFFPFADPAQLPGRGHDGHDRRTGKVAELRPVRRTGPAAAAALSAGTGHRPAAAKGSAEIDFIRILSTILALHWQRRWHFAGGIELYGYRDNSNLSRQTHGGRAI